jgi:glycerol-3-phosphate dehydrogenase
MCIRDREEVDYFIDLVAHVFPGIPVTRAHIVHRFAGVRPLPGHGDMAPGFVSRDYRIEADRLPGADAPTVLSLVGGKWTTFRALGESLANTVLGLLGAERRVSTAKLAIGGGVDFPATSEAAAAWMRTHLAEVPAGRHAQLLERYGTRARAVAAFLSQGDDREILGGRVSTRELAWMVENEQAVHLSDVLLRRTDLAFTGALSDEVLVEIADALAEAAGWDADTLAAELAATRAELAARFGVELAPALAD